MATISTKNKLLKAFEKLSKEEQSDMVKEILLFVENGNPDVILERKKMTDADRCCPDCDSKHVIKHSIYKGRRRYKCKSCGVTFNDLTGTSVHRIHKKEKWFKCIELMFNRKYVTLKEMCAELGVSEPTALDWRHKILASFEKIESSFFSGIIEMDGILLKLSRKGRKSVLAPKKNGKKAKKRGISNEQMKVLMTCDRYKNFDFKLVTTGRISADEIEETVGSKIDSLNNILASDSHPSIESFATNKGVRHVNFISSTQRVVNDIFHVQTINSLARRFKEMVNRQANGVSTKYLQNYLNWFRIKMKFSEMNDKAKLCFTSSLSDNKAWGRFVKTEEKFLSFADRNNIKDVGVYIRNWKSENWM